jgi:AraC family cel operon transcriptional repressor
MAAVVFRARSYLRAGESFHFARKKLHAARPGPLHSHDFYEMLLVRNGTARHRVNGSSEMLERGDLLFIRPDDTHALAAQAGSDCTILNVLFLAETARHLASRYGDEFGGRFFWSDAPLPTRIRLHGPQLERAVNNTQDLENTIRSLARIEQFLLSLMTHVLDATSTMDPRAPAWLARACREAHRPEIFRTGVPALVAEAGRGHEHVCRQMRTYLGMSPTQYLNKVRVQHAAMLLANSELSLADVALDCGFENQSYFHRLFRRRYGCTPTDFRRRRWRDPMGAA